jgi:hypothetical protein
VYCDSVLYLDDRLVLPGTEEEEEEQIEQSQETDCKPALSPGDSCSNETQNEENREPHH